MPKLIKNKPYGVLQNGFFAAVDDYPIAGGWGLKGKLFAVGDASGSVHAFDGTSGQEIWKNTEGETAQKLNKNSTTIVKKLTCLELWPENWDLSNFW